MFLAFVLLMRFYLSSKISQIRSSVYHVVSSSADPIEGHYVVNDDNDPGSQEKDDDSYTKHSK